MKQLFSTGLALIALVCFFGCFSKKPLPEPQWQSRPAAIKIHYRADRSVNQFDGRPHTMLLVVYQLKSPDFFSKLSKDEDGLKRLLRFETVQERLAGNQDDVAACHRFIINPAEEKTLVLDRNKDVKGVGIVAGYYNLVPGRVNHFWELPVQYERKGLLFRKIEATVDALAVDLQFGPHELTVQEKVPAERAEEGDE